MNTVLQINFVSDTCRDGRLEVYLPSRSADYPFMSVCGHNATALKDLPLLTSKDVEEAPIAGQTSSSSMSVIGESSRYHHNGRRRRRYVHVRFVGNAYPHKAHFKIAWSELTHLPKNQDGTLRTARRTAADHGGDGECAFSCPGDERLCLPARSVCNGVINCPGVLNDESPTTCEEWYQNGHHRSSSPSPGYYGPSAVILFGAVTAAIIVFGVTLFASNAYCRRRRPTAAYGCRALADSRSSDRIYSTVIYTCHNVTLLFALL